MAATARPKQKKIAITTDGKTSFDILAKVSLSEHTYRVARLMIEKIKKHTNSYSVFIPRGVILALGHDIGKIGSQRDIPIEDVVLESQDHPYISAMMIKQKFPDYKHIEETCEIISAHHIPIEANAGIYAESLKAADHEARRQETAEWFIKTYGKDYVAPDPYQIIDVGDYDGKAANEIEAEARAAFAEEAVKIEPQIKDKEIEEIVEIKEIEDVIYNAQTGEIISDNRVVEEKKEADEKAVTDEKQGESIDKDFAVEEKAITEKKQALKKGEFGDRKSPSFIVKQDSKNDKFEVSGFELNRYEAALLETISTAPVMIGKKKNTIDEPDICVFPYNDRLLVNYSTLLKVFRSVINEQSLTHEDYLRMTNYAIGEWKKKEIVVDVGEGFFSRIYEFTYDGRQVLATLIPFAMEKLNVDSGDKLAEAKQNAFYPFISKFAFARKRER
jgi:hypothetical protein